MLHSDLQAGECVVAVDTLALAWRDARSGLDVAGLTAALTGRPRTPVESGRLSLMRSEISATWIGAQNAERFNVRNLFCLPVLALRD